MSNHLPHQQLSENYKFAFAVAQYLDDAITSGRRSFRRRSTYQLVRTLDEAIQALIAGDLMTSRPWSPLLVGPADDISYP